MTIAYTIALAIGFGLIVVVGNRLKRDRLGITLQVLGILGFFNLIDSNYPTDSKRFGFGCPFKFNYDPAYRHTGKAGEIKAVTPQSDWKFDSKALLWDIAIGLGVLGAALIVNEVIQISNGNRTDPLIGAKTDMW